MCLDYQTVEQSELMQLYMEPDKNTRWHTSANEHQQV